MSRAATATETDLWRMQTRMARDVVYANVQGLTHEDSLVQPRPGGNCLNFVLGHLLSVYDGLLRMLGEKPVMDGEALQRYARGAPPIEGPAEALEFGRLLQAWGDASERVDAAVGAIDPETLDRPVPASPTNNPDETLRSLLTTVMFHQAYHAGQTAVLRRIAGKEGAIR